MTRVVDAVLEPSRDLRSWRVTIREFDLIIPLPNRQLRTGELRDLLNDAVSPRLPAGTNYVVSMVPGV